MNKIFTLSICNEIGLQNNLLGAAKQNLHLLQLGVKLSGCNVCR
jgi:hypothetical protein